MQLIEQQGREGGTAVRRPADWPGPGPIDLEVHDLPHQSAAIEWWYFNFHATTDTGDDFSGFASFYRYTDDVDEGEDARMYGVVWALVDVSRNDYVTEVLLDRKLPRVIREKSTELIPDPILRRALDELLARDVLPRPDAVFAQRPDFALDTLRYATDRAELEKVAPGEYALRLRSDDRSTEIELRVQLTKPALRHGDDGVVAIANEEMFYYFSPRCRVDGSVTRDGTVQRIRDGIGWYDHEFGNLRSEGADGLSWRARSSTTAAWTWFCAVLDDGRELVGYEAVDRERPEEDPTRLLLLVDRDGCAVRTTAFELQTVATWASTATFTVYPSTYRLVAPALDLDLELEAEFPQQEFRTLLSWPGFFEGRVRLRGTAAGGTATGLGFVERAGYGRKASQQELLRAVGLQTRAAVDTMLRPDGAITRQLIVDRDHDRILDGYDLEQYQRVVADPIRELVNRSGKAWRSFALMVAIDAVGGDPNEFSDWLAIPELIHTGSLIVDDVQDDSDIRRGGPAVHTVIGVPLAINAGCASYFFAQLPMRTSTLSDSIKCRWYDCYFEAMRGAHAGQAADIAGAWALVPQAASTGDSDPLERRVLTTHRLKSGIAPANVARMAVIIGGGTDAQSEAIGRLFEAYGTAFQITDDVLNMSGFENEGKTTGEDAEAGKITLPIAKAFGLLDAPSRVRLQSLLRRDDLATCDIEEVIGLVESSGALLACEQEAERIVETAWAETEGVMDDSMAKVALRAFGWYLLDRRF